jgi:hypothetical protein
MSCAFLEVWLSEIWLLSSEREFLRQLATRRDRLPPVAGLGELVQRYPAPLYRACLLLSAVLAPEHLQADELLFRPRPADATAIASRHWYSTACLASPTGPMTLPLVPVRLPGHFSVRGDWDLAIAKGSLSYRLGERALDLLSSRRANVERLRRGIGLPTRDVISPRKRGRVWTKLSVVREDGSVRRLFYQDLRRLGASSDLARRDRQAFYWLWRSSLANYDRHARFWQIWLCWMVGSWKELFGQDFPGRTAFQAYDEIREGRVDPGKLRGFKGEFRMRCDYLLAALKQASLA